MALTLLGNITLNIGTVLYLIVYLPQIRHNRHDHHIIHLSLVMNLCFFFSYHFDLIYGWCLSLPWQYKLVSTAGTLCAIAQHCQVTKSLFKQSRYHLAALHLFILFSTLLAVIYFFKHMHATALPYLGYGLGTISHALFVGYAFPQIFKNYRLKSAMAINKHFLAINLALTTLNMTSAWCLDWPWPNKISSPIMVLAMILLCIQRFRYHPKRSFYPKLSYQHTS